jgi:hypothetical protein
LFLVLVVVFYFTLNKQKLQIAFFEWSSITLTATRKLLTHLAEICFLVRTVSVPMKDLGMSTHFSR